MTEPHPGITNEACQACGLYNKAEKYKATPYGVGCNVPGKKISVFVVTDKLYEHESVAGRFLSDKAGQWVVSMLKLSGVTFIIDAVIRCSAAKPTPKQKVICSEAHLLSNIKKTQPAVIFCLGLDAAQAVLGSKLNINQLTKAGVLEGPDKIPVVVVDHPSKHSAYRHDQWNGNDLRPAYERAFFQMDYILRHGWTKPVIEFECHKEVEGALLACESIALATPIFSWDTEFGIQDDRNVSHHTTKLLSMGCGWRCPDGSYELHVFDMRDWDVSQRLKVISALLRQSIIVSTFVKIDIQVAFFTSLYDAFNGQAAIKDLFDTGQIRWLQDQESYGNGLEDQAVQYCGAPRWKFETTDALEKIKAEKTIPLEEGLTNYDYRHLDRDYCNLYQAWDIYWQARVWWERYAHEDNPAQMREEFDTWPWRRTQAVTEFLCLCERTGIVVDLDYMKLYQNAMESKIKVVEEWIQSHPFVQTLMVTPDPDKPGGPVFKPDGSVQLNRQRQPKIEPPSMLLPETGLNPASSLQMRKLFHFLGLEAKMKSDKTKEPKIDKRELLRQCGGVATGVARTGRERFFYSILLHRSHKKQLVSFIAPFTSYAVPARTSIMGYEPGQMRVHTQFKMSKVESGQGGTDDIIEGGVDTGRNSSADPCISNMDKKPIFREAFPAPPGYIFWEVDQASVEPRVLAYNADCESWIKLFEMMEKEPENKEHDLYRVEWAKFQRAQGKTWIQPGDVDDEARQTCKPLVLGGMYEATAQGVSGRENIPYDICKAFMDSFWDGIPEILAYNAEVRRKVFEGEMVVSTSGRQARFDLHQSYLYDHAKYHNYTLERLGHALRMPEDDAHILRKAGNHMTQSTAKDITDVLAIEAVRLLKSRGVRWCAFNNTVHDSLWGYCPDEKFRELYFMLKKLAQDLKLIKKWGIQFNTQRRIILDIEAKVGPTLGSLAKVKFTLNKTLQIPGLF